MLGFFDFDRKAAFNGFADILHQFLKRFALGGAARNGRDFRPGAPFFRLMNNNLDFRR
jgi:hypothetical protein